MSDLSTKQIGNINEAKCLARFIELGYEVSIPYGDSAKYDLIVDINGKLLRMQCKNPREIVDEDQNVVAIEMNTFWSSGYTRLKRSKRVHYSSNDCDFIVSHYKGINYLIPVETISNKSIFTIRFGKTKSGQKSKINPAEKYVDYSMIKNLGY